MFEIGIIFAIFAAISFAFANLFSKALSNKTSPINSVLYQGFFITIFSFIIYLLFEKKLEIPNILELIVILIGGVSGFVALFYLFKSFQNLEVGKTLVIANTYPFIILLLSTFILKDKFEFLNIIPMILIFIGILFLFNLKKNEESFKYLIFPIIVSINWGIFYFSISYISRQNLSGFGIVFYLQLVLFLTALIYGIFSKKINFYKKNLSEISFFSAISGFLVLLGILFITFSQFTINPAISSSIKSFELIITSILAVFFYKEYLNFKNIIGILIAFSGIVLFNFI